MFWSDTPEDPAGGWRYLEAAPEDLPGTYEWGPYGEVVSGADGTGKQNTADIVSAYPGGNYAANAADGNAVNGYSDWFLPSRDELNEMYDVLHSNGVGGFAGDSYWSSSEYGSVYDRSKYDGNYVRPVRAY